MSAWPADRRQRSLAIALALAALVGCFFLGRALTGDERREPAAFAPDPGALKLPAVGELALARGVPELAEGQSGGQGGAEPPAPLTPEPELAAETGEVPADEEPIAATPEAPPEPEPPAPAPPAPSPPPPPAPEPKPDKPDKPPKPDDTTTFDDTG
jgi:outer membrane biosynthesis protein TonB